MKRFSLYILSLFCLFTGFSQNQLIPGNQQNSSDDMSDFHDKIELPPLSIFIEAANSHASVRIHEARREYERSNLKTSQMQWLDYIRLTGLYQYGEIVSLNSSSASDLPLYYTSNGKVQSTYNVGVSMSIPLGNLFSNGSKNKAIKSKIKETEYDYQIAVEERKLKILEAYNKVVEQLAILPSKAETATLYNAQIRISEQDFLNGKISINDLALERSRRSAALVSYQEARVSLHNSITILEILTNVKILNR